MNDLSTRLAKLSPGMRRILAQRLGIKDNGASRPQTIPQRNAPDRHARLSFAQERLWFLEQFEPGSPTYHIYPAYRLKGLLNVAALEHSFSEIVRRHEALRTTFVSQNGSPLQVVSDAQPMKLPVVDLSGSDSARKEAEVKRLAVIEAQRPFDLGAGPLLRAKLLRLTEQEHVLLLTIHHIISDGWSMGLLFRELATLYEASLSSLPAPLTELPIQYPDFAEWQRTSLSGERLNKNLSYWKGQLAGLLPSLELTTDYPRPAFQTYQGATERLLLSKELTDSLKQLGQREGVTPFMLLLTAFYTLLYRYTEQDDFAIGTPIAGRNLTEVEDLIGLFVNTLVLRADLAGNPTFQELLKRVRTLTLDAYAHQDLPFEKLVEELQPERNLSSSPLFNAMFDYQATPNMALALAGLELEYIAIERPTAIFDLAVTAVDLAAGLRLSITYKTDLFESTTISAMLRHFARLLEGVVDDPAKAITTYPLHDEESIPQLEKAWQAECVHRVFESQVEQTPESVAVICDGEYLTYAELNRRANQLARYLQSLNVTTGVCVGLCVERSLDIVVGLLGILKAGGVYVPLDPSYPKERLTFIMEDTRMPVILTQDHIAPRVPGSLNDVKVVRLDADKEIIARHTMENLVAGLSAENLAYVIYTSGSVGQPKGVLISHEMCLNHSLDVRQHFGVEPTDKVLEFASINFDVSLEQMLPALLTGATVVLRDGEVWGGADFYRKLLETETTIANLPTAYWHQIVQEGVQQTELQGNYSLKLMIPGGEAVQPEIASLWQKTPIGSARLLNAYGPTETTMTATTFDIPRLPSGENALKRIPIGYPLANRTFYILDPRGASVPPGIPGELHIGGPLLAWGYLNQPALSAEKFIPDYFSDVSGARLYRTGDRTRLLHDGGLEFLGRVDRQVKVRGYRIEPGEIEVALSQHPAVQANAVKACEGERGEKRLVAYVVTHSKQSTSDLRSFLAEKIPSYMVPAAFVMLDHLPLTPNGKVDYRSLPNPDHIRPEMDGTYVAPRNAVEETLAGIWSAVLGIEHVGIHDNFFDLGGDSILGLQIIARANQSQLRLTPKQLFQFQTIAELAVVAETATAVRAEQGMVTGPVLLSAIQRWFFERDLPEPHHYNQSFLFDVPRKLQPDLLGQAVQHLTLHHDALRLRFCNTQSGWEQFHAGADAVTAFEYLDLANLTPEDQRLAIRLKAAETQAGLSLEAGPLMRCVLFNRGGQATDQFLAVIHHLIVDGVSWRIIVEDLQTAYEQLERGEQPRLPEKTSSFKQWMERLTEYARTSEDLHRELEYWHNEQQVSCLPLHRGLTGANVTSSARAIRVSLTEVETQQLIQEVPSAYNTQINDVLLSAFVIAYKRWTGSESILIDLEGHGREELFDDVDLTRTVGWFTTLFPVLLEIDELDPQSVLKRVKEHLRGIPNKGIGYGLLKYLNSEAGLKTGQRAEVSFNYLGQFEQDSSETSLFRLSRDPSGAVCSPQSQRSYLVEVNAMIVRKQLQVGWTYSQNVHSRTAIEEWADTYIDSLRQLIQHCLSPEAGGFTPSDFPESNLDARELEAVLVELAE